MNGILKAGNVAGGSILSGGTGIRAASGAELVIRTDGANDALTINTPILANGGNALTKSGAGTLTLGAANHTYTGTTTVNAGTLTFGPGSSLTAGGKFLSAQEPRSTSTAPRDREQRCTRGWNQRDGGEYQPGCWRFSYGKF